MATEVDFQFVSLESVRNQSLAWKQVKGWKARYELRANNDSLIAVMDWDGIFKMTATVHSAGGSWHLARRGFFRMHTDLSVGDYEEPVLKLDNGWTGGNLTLINGHALRWRGTNFWGTKYAFIDEASERALISYEYRGFFKYHADITLDPEAYSLPQLDMLLSLGWYQIILHMMDSAASSSGAMVATMG